MTEHSRRSFLKSAAVSGAMTTGAVLLPIGIAGAATATTATSRRLGEQRQQAQRAPQIRSTATYRLRVTNNSTIYEHFAVYQNDPDLGLPDVMSLAWFVKGAFPQQTVTFEWTETYSFALLAEKPPAQLIQTVPVDPYDPAKQQAQLGYAEGALTLKLGQAVSDPKPGSIYLREFGDVPEEGAGIVGLVVDKQPAYALFPAPNTEVVFTVKQGANYWLTAGNVAPGAFLDIEEIVTPAAIDFAPGVFDLTAVLGPDNTWTVAPTNTSTSSSTSGAAA